MLRWISSANAKLSRWCQTTQRTLLPLRWARVRRRHRLTFQALCSHDEVSFPGDQKFWYKEAVFYEVYVRCHSLVSLFSHTADGTCSVARLQGLLRLQWRRAR